MFSLSKACCTKPRNQVKILILPWCNMKCPTWQWIAIPMDLLYARQARSDLPVSFAVRMQVWQASTNLHVKRPQSRLIRPISKNQAQAISNLLPIGTYVMYKTSPNKLWYVGIVTNILQDRGCIHHNGMRWSHIQTCQIPFKAFQSIQATYKSK